MAARILAFLVAVGMVVGAIAYRQGRDDPGGGGDGGGDGSDAVVVCAAELGNVCDSVEGAQVEPVAETADRLLAGGAVDLDAWIAPGPWAAMVDDGRTRDAFSRRQAVAHSPLVAVTRGTPPGCAAQLSWPCLTDVARAADPAFLVAADDGQGMGLFVRAAALTAFLQRADYDRLDVETGEAATMLTTLSSQLETARARGARSLAEFVITSGSVKAFLTWEAAATQANAAGRNLTVVTPEPVARIEAVVATTGEKGRDALDVGGLEEALGRSGWKPGAAPQPDNLPGPGVLLALRESVR